MVTARNFEVRFFSPKWTNLYEVGSFPCDGYKSDGKHISPSPNTVSVHAQ
jgi:hypothetical protein